MNKNMTSRERVLAAIRRQPVDYVPCAPLMKFQEEDQRWGKTWQYPFGPSIRETLEYMVKQLGVDQLLQIETSNCGLGFFPDPEVESSVWQEDNIIHKSWKTPSGELHASIHYDEHWVPGFDIPFFHDYNPSHFVEPWITSMQDVDCLKHILKPPQKADELDGIRFQYHVYKQLAAHYQVATSLEVGMGLSGAVNMFGPTQISMLTISDPGLVDAYLEVDHQYNLKMIEIGLELGIDMIRRNGFYETCDLFSPNLLKKFLENRLKNETKLVHSAGKLMGYSILSGYTPILDYLSNIGFDCLFCPDIFLNSNNGQPLVDKMGHHTSFWSGPSDTLHMPWNKPEEVRKAVRKVFEVFGKKGLILTPCSSCKAVFPWNNVLAMVDEWKKLR